MKFLADVMLGRLARWLRILGCDVAYDAAWEDDRLLELSHQEGRVLLTRDTRLACRRRAQNCVLVTSDHWREQLKQVVKTCGIEVGKRGATQFSRCVECNGILEPTDQATVRYNVPAHVSDSHEEFRQCLDCRRIYWRGSHCQAIQGILAELFPSTLRRGPPQTQTLSKGFRYMGKFDQYGEMTAFALDAVHKSLTKIRALAGGGTETVATREGEYKAWDPEVFRVDKESEDNFVACVEAAGLNAVILSEELKRKEIAGQGDLVYVISDPFDGSLLYKRQIPAFWFTSLAVFDKDGNPLTAVVGDCAANSVDFATEEKAYTGKFVEGELVAVHEITPSKVTELKNAFLESYLMKPKFLYPTVLKYQPLLSKLKFILPNGGPAGFADVAAGRVDIYFAVGQPYIEIFSGCAIAQRAGCVITTFDGKPVQFEDNIDQCYDVLCTSNQVLHDKVLEELSQIQ